MSNSSEANGGHPRQSRGNVPRRLGTPSRKVGGVPPNRSGSAGQPRATRAQEEGSPRQAKKKKTRHQDGWSITTVAWALAIVIGFFGWAFAAASYARAAEGWSGMPEQVQPQNFTRLSRSAARTTFLTAAVSSLCAFLWNAVIQIPNAPWVLMHVLRNAIWLLAIVILLEGLVVLFVQYDRKLAKESSRARRGERPAD